VRSFDFAEQTFTGILNLPLEGVSQERWKTR
jgi:hypothetical protein